MATGNLSQAIRSTILTLIKRDPEVKQAIIDAVKEAEARDRKRS